MAFIIYVATFYFSSQEIRTKKEGTKEMLVNMEFHFFVKFMNHQMEKSREEEKDEMRRNAETKEKLQKR